MLRCEKSHAALQERRATGGAAMATAKILRRQAERCAALAKQTHDDDARVRYLRLEQTYIQLAEAEEAVESSTKPAAA
jgi:hypothetical protein